MQTNLVLNLHCSECGAPLEFVRGTRETNTQIKAEEFYVGMGNYKNLGGHIPSNAVGLQAQFVAPCKSCIDKVVLPAKNLISAIESLTKV